MGIMPDVPPGIRQFGPYRIIGPHADDGIKPELLILDTNVLIDIRDLFFKGPGSVAPDLEDLLAAFPNLSRNAVDINYGWATSEATWKRGAGTDLTARRQLVHAAATVVDWNGSQIRAALANRHPPVNRDRRWPRVPLGDPREIVDPRRMLVAHYGSLLYLLRLYRDRQKWRSKSPLWPIEQFVDWTSHTLGIRDSYALGIAVSLLIGDSEAKNEANRVLKLSGNDDGHAIGDKAWNVAWDLTMVSLAEGMSYALLPIDRPTPTALVTRDLDPMLIRIGTELRTLIDNGREKLPMSMVSLRTHARIDQTDLSRILDHDVLDSVHRSQRDAGALASQAANAVRGLEEDLGITRPAFADGWPAEPDG